MDKLASLVFQTSKVRSFDDDDFADRLSSRYTVVLLIVFAMLVSMNQYVRNPISCWAPVHFTGAHTRFTTHYCWVKNTYYIPWNVEVPPDDQHKKQVLPYYQWVPIILLLQAVLFFTPSAVWHGLNSKAGVDADNILAAAHTVSRMDKSDCREKTLALLSKQMGRFFVSRRSRDSCDAGCFHPTVFIKRICNLCSRREGSYLLILFLVSKILYIANVIGQLFLLNIVLATRYNTFGIDMIRNLVSNKDWTEPEESYVAFPRVTYCDFQIRGQDLGNTQQYTVQCVLPINMYNEKIYLFLWYWMVVLAGISIASLLTWILRAMLTGDRVRFIWKHLCNGGRLVGDGKEDEKLVRKFTAEYLGQDGAFLFRLVAHNTDNITTMEIVCAVWDLWRGDCGGHGGGKKRGAFSTGESSEAETLPIKRQAKE